MLYDNDLLSIQEARNLLKQAHLAQKRLMDKSQEEIDIICKAIVDTGIKNADKLAQMAVEETGFGVKKHKIIKNLVATEYLWKSIKDLKTVGLIDKDEQNKIYQIAEPMGVVAGIIPSTNPTSTTLFKAIIALKSRNSIVFSPHPNAVKCILETTKLIIEASVKAGAPEGSVGCISLPTMEGTKELMTHKLTSVILATGGSGLVKAAYSSGKPAYGVGPGNVPVYVEKSADLPQAVTDIITGKSFDYGTVCASEQSVVVDKEINSTVKQLFKERKAYFLNKAEIKALENTLTPNGRLNSKLVAKSPHFIASAAGINVHPDTSVLICELDGVGRDYPLSMEKLSPVLSYYTVKDWKEACDVCYQVLKFGGLGHSMGIHTKNEDIIMNFALKKPVFRILVNTPTTHGAVGATTALEPSLTLGCGTFGGNITSDNVTPLHLLNIKRVAFGIKNIDGKYKTEYETSYNNNNGSNSNKLDEDDLKTLVEKFIREKYLR